MLKLRRVQKRHEPCYAKRNIKADGRDGGGRTSSQAAKAPTEATEASTNASPTAWLSGLDGGSLRLEGINTSRKFQRLSRCAEWESHMRPLTLSSHPPACQTQLHIALVSVVLRLYTKEGTHGTKVGGRGRGSNSAAKISCWVSSDFREVQSQKHTTVTNMFIGTQLKTPCDHQSTPSAQKV